MRRGGSLKEVFCLLAAQRLFFEDYRIIYRRLSLFVFSFVCFLFPQARQRVVHL